MTDQDKLDRDYQFLKLMERLDKLEAMIGTIGACYHNGMRQMKLDDLMKDQ